MSDDAFLTRNTRPEDFDAITEISRRIYPHDKPWTADYLAKHLEIFPEGQFVAVEEASGRVVGMAASLIITWDDYDSLGSYNYFTDRGYFTNHDPTGRTLYGAEVMVDPEFQRLGIGSLLYDAREELTERLHLLRIRAGARLPGYHRYAAEMDAETYVVKVMHGVIDDPTLSFQLHRNFHVLAVVENYYEQDVKSKDYAALIEWINLKEAKPEHLAGRKIRFQQGRPPGQSHLLDEPEPRRDQAD